MRIKCRKCGYGFRVDSAYATASFISCRRCGSRIVVNRNKCIQNDLWGAAFILAVIIIACLLI